MANEGCARPLRAAVIGTGFVGPHHVDAVRRGGYGDVVAIAGSDPERTRTRADALGVARWTTDIATLLSDPAIDVVHVCTPNRTHVAVATAVLEAGKHLVLEKPIAVDRAGAAVLLAAADRAGRHAMVALTYRGYPMLRRARALVRDGALGKVRLVHGAYLQDWLTRPTDYNWRLEPEIGGPSRAVADIGTHWFDAAEYVTGDRVEAVVADLATFIRTRERRAVAAPAFGAGSGPVEEVRVDSEDAATILVRFAGGARGAVVVSQVSPGRRNAFSLEVAGAERSLRWDQEDPERLWVGDLEGARILARTAADGPVGPGIPSLPAGHPEGWGGALRDLLRPFYAAIAAGEPPPPSDAPPGGVPYPTLRDGARGVAFVAAVLASARKGRWVALEDVVV